MLRTIDRMKHKTRAPKGAALELLLKCMLHNFHSLQIRKAPATPAAISELELLNTLRVTELMINEIDIV